MFPAPVTSTARKFLRGPKIFL